MPLIEKKTEYKTRNGNLIISAKGTLYPRDRVFYLVKNGTYIKVTLEELGMLARLKGDLEEDRYVTYRIEQGLPPGKGRKYLWDYYRKCIFDHSRTVPEWCHEFKIGGYGPEEPPPRSQFRQDTLWTAANYPD